ncbi:MAG TPA: phosphate acyltransferase PlsX [Candidatus Omnitrophota bacterium]|nr:phosphate acyltransferase PlsX [Candidatus Omnitrophota bacterium]
MKIIVDAMGGDHAPDVVVEGAIAAVKEYGVDLVLVGDESAINDLLKKHRYAGTRITVHPSQEVIGMSEHAAASVRKKRKSSIVVGMGLVGAGVGDAFVSAGNTGAVVCAATLELRLLPGVERAGIAVITPTLNGISLLIDVGANIDPKPIQLVQYGIMGQAYSKFILNKTNPTVGLLNIGEEETKGTDVVKDAYELLSKSGLNFVGNVEPKDIFSGKSDVIVCDGFVGNVMLKVAESAAETLNILLKRSLMSNPLGKLGLILLKKSFVSYKKQLDYSEYGGAPLLGVNGVVIISHGRSNPKAIKNAIRVSKEEVERKVNEKIIEAVSKAGDKELA